MDVTKSFGSDVFDPYTTKYCWQSNQVAHAMMGFAGTTLVAHAVISEGHSLWWALAFLAIPIMKDITDYFVDENNVGSIFELKDQHRKELCIDGLTDFFFWSAGTLLAVVSYYAIQDPVVHLCYLLGFVVVYIVSGFLFLYKPQLAKKIEFDKSNLPYYYRLPRFGTDRLPSGVTRRFDRKTISSNRITEIVEAFMGESGPAHILLVGLAGTGKTKLACGIGSGLIARGKSVRYRTSEKLRENLLDTSGRGISELLQADTIICDDMFNLYEETDVIDIARKALKCKNIVWVLAREDKHLADWENCIQNELDKCNQELEVIRLEKQTGGPNKQSIPFKIYVMIGLTWLVVLALFGYVVRALFCN